MPEIKQAEKEAIQNVLEEYKGKIPVKEFADKIKTELLPLKINERSKERWAGSNWRGYEDVSLPSDLRGDVARYKENVYESPIQTTAGSFHYPGDTDNYFAHTRIEDLLPQNTNGHSNLSVADDNNFNVKIRRIIEIQSDLFQKGRLEKETQFSTFKDDEETIKFWDEASGGLSHPLVDRAKEIRKLKIYENTWHERIIREEIKQAAKDGKNTLQFPTGETAMKIEGLVNRADKWVTLDNELITDGSNIKRGDVISYQDHNGNVHDYRRFAITKNYGDGTFDAVDIMSIENDEKGYVALRKHGYMNEDGEIKLPKVLSDEFIEDVKEFAEQLSAKNTVDKKNPIYKFYESEIQKYLKRLVPQMQRIIDPQGVEWFQIDIDPSKASEPINAFAKKDDEDSVA